MALITFVGSFLWLSVDEWLTNGMIDRLLDFLPIILLSTDRYLDYLTTPFVLFIKDKLSQVVFIVLHCRVCVMASFVEPQMEEYVIFVYFCGLVLSEYQQYKSSPFKYFK